VGSEKSSITSKEKLSNDKFIDDKLIQKEIASLGSKSSNEKMQTVFSQLKLQNASQPSKQIQSMIDGLANNVNANIGSGKVHSIMPGPRHSNVYQHN
jgi:hypothetical protein